MLEVSNIRSGYGDGEVLQGISLRVGDGEVVCLIGSNGAGKTTTLRTLSGLIQPSSGSVKFMGQDIGGRRASSLVATGLSMVPEGRRVFAPLTVLENLEMGAYSVRDPKQAASELDRVFELFPRLKERSSQPAGTLSGGEQQMLAIGRALMSRPRLLLLDEPSMGLAPMVVAEIFSTIQRLNEAGIAILLAEQNARLALRVSDRGYVLQTGRIVMDADADDLSRNDDVRNAYLGV
jgi:branched-chain amino acid transport system ATP-binding protein